MPNLFIFNVISDMVRFKSITLSFVPSWHKGSEASNNFTDFCKVWNVKLKSKKLRVWKRMYKGQMWSDIINRHFKPHTLILLGFFSSFFSLKKLPKKKKIHHILYSPIFIPLPGLFFTPALLYIDPSYHLPLFPLTEIMSFRISCSVNLMTMNYFTWKYLFKIYFEDYLCWIQNSALTGSVFCSFFTSVMPFKFPDFHCFWEVTLTYV